MSVIVVFALLACGLFFGWRYLFAGKPFVVITAPPSNYEAVEGEEVTVEARAMGRSIVRMELWVDDGLMDSASSPDPQDVFSAGLTWQASGVGPHTAQVKAYSLGGRDSDPVTVTLEVVEAAVGGGRSYAYQCSAPRSVTITYAVHQARFSNTGHSYLDFTASAVSGHTYLDFTGPCWLFRPPAGDRLLQVPGERRSR